MALLTLALAACATTGPLPTADEPQLARVAQPYAHALRAVGITRVISPGNGGMVKLDTEYGTVYVPYPPRVQPLAFVLDLGPGSVRARAASHDPAQDERILAALVPVAVQVTEGNNALSG